MKKILRILVLLALTSEWAIAQSPQQLNLQKYWNYRDRFFKYFIATSPDNLKGSNIPAMNIDNNVFNCNDGNEGMQYYIGWLATEYKLLQLYGQDVTETRNYLLWALNAVERLDYTAEVYFRRGDCTPALNFNDPDGMLNGFMIRDDVDASIKAINPNLNSFIFDNRASRYTEQIHFLPGDAAHIHDFEESKDNIWNYLINLALVKVLVDDPEINYKAKRIAYRMVNWMHSLLGWYIINPVTGCIVNCEDETRGTIDEAIAAGNTLGFSFGFASAADWITDTTINGITFPEWGSLHFRESLGRFSDFDYHMNYSKDYSYQSLATIADINDPYEISDANIPPIETHILKNYPHLPLIYLLLHGRQKIVFNSEMQPCQIDPITPDGISVATAILSSAPDCGTSYDNPGTSWYHSNWLTTASRDPNCQGEYNGIDYMLWHNLIWLVYYIPYDESLNLNGELPDLCTITVHDMPIQYEFGNDDVPLFRRATNNITCTSHLKSDANANVYSQNIDLLPGFKADLGAKFRAKAGLNDETVPNFIKSSSNCINSGKLNCSGRIIQVNAWTNVIVPGEGLCYDVTNANSFNFTFYDLFHSIIFQGSGSISNNHVCIWPLLCDPPYWVNIEFRNECYHISNYYLLGTNEKSAKITSTTENKKYESKSSFSLHPNPTSDKLFVEGLTDFEVQVFDISGRKVLSAIKANWSIDMTGLDPGIYMLHLKSAGKTYIQKVVKQ